MSGATMRERFGGKGDAGVAVENGEAMTSLDGVVKRFVDSWTPGGVQYEDIVWFNVFFLVVVHIGALYGLALAFKVESGMTLLALALGLLYPLSGMGITIGAHRLASHRSFKAHWTVRVVLAMLNSLSYQGSLVTWSRDHRVHHMKSESNGDPYNYSRGPFFAHIGWIMLRKHPEVIAAGKKLNFDDLWADPVFRIQHQLYLPSVAVFCYALPTLLGYYATGHIWASFFVLGVFRHLFVLHCTWCVNSLAHALSHGYRPYNDKINPAENVLVSILAMGEGFHNAHHQYPKDYRAAEGLWWQFFFNPSTLVIDALAAVGLVWDLHTTRPALFAKHKAAVLAGTASHSHHILDDPDEPEHVHAE